MLINQSTDPMTHKSSDHFICYLDGNGHGETIQPEQVDEFRQKPGFIWFHLDQASPEQCQWLKNQDKIPKVFRNRMLQDLARAQIKVENDTLLFCFFGLNSNTPMHQFDITSLHMWISDNEVITIAPAIIYGLVNIKTTIQLHQAPQTVSDFLVELNFNIASNYAALVQQYQNQLEQLEIESMQIDIINLHQRILELRRKAISLKHLLSPQRNMLESTSYYKRLSWLSEEDFAYLDDSKNRMVQTLEDIDSMKERALLLYEEVRCHMSEKIEQRIRILTLFSVIFLPILFAATLLGFNMSFISRRTEEITFIATCAILIITIAGLIGWLKRKRFF